MPNIPHCQISSVCTELKACPLNISPFLINNGTTCVTKIDDLQFFFISSLNHGAHYNIAVILIFSFQMLLQNTTGMIFDHNGIRFSTHTFWPEAQEVLMALLVLEMSELIAFTKPCSKRSVQISVAFRLAFNKNKALQHKEESQLLCWSSCFSYKYKDVHRGDTQVHQPHKNKISYSP